MGSIVSEEQFKCESRVQHQAVELWNPKMQIVTDSTLYQLPATSMFADRFLNWVRLPVSV